jgi:hypothetical protein
MGNLTPFAFVVRVYHNLDGKKTTPTLLMAVQAQ